MKKNELEARNEVKWETYTKKIQIEARVMGDLSMSKPLVHSQVASLIAGIAQSLDAVPAADIQHKYWRQSFNILPTRFSPTS